jgi:hypothetical protein
MSCEKYERPSFMHFMHALHKVPAALTRRASEELPGAKTILAGASGCSRPIISAPRWLFVYSVFRKSQRCHDLQSARRPLIVPPWAPAIAQRFPGRNNVRTNSIVKDQGIAPALPCETAPIPSMREGDVLFRPLVPLFHYSSVDHNPGSPCKLVRQGPPQDSSAEASSGSHS